MHVIAKQISVEGALRIVHRSEVFLVLAAIITTLGLLALAFALLRKRKDDHLLQWFAAFAILYGVRLGINHQPLWDFGVKAPLLESLTMGFGYLVPIPAFFFFQTLGMMNRMGRIIIRAVSPLLVVLCVLTLVLGPHRWIELVNNSIITLSLVLFVIDLALDRQVTDDTKLIRRALALFMFAAMYENIAQYTIGDHFNIEPFIFLVLLGVLGFVAARRTLYRDQQLTVMEQELEIAQRIQRAILPQQFPSSPHFSVAANYSPMRVVAGDFYDFLRPSPTQAGLLIADVAGHGVPAALIASMVKLVSASLTPIAQDPAQVLRRLNTELRGNVVTQFVTAAYVFLDAEASELRYAAAAHPPMLLLRGDSVTAIEENGLLLGAFDFATYTAQTVALQPGDRVVLYTDGLLEGANAAGEEFGSQRLADLLRDTRGMTAEECSAHLVQTVLQWSATQDDDLTVLVCDCHSTA